MVDEVPFSPVTSTLNGGATVAFDVPWTEKLDEPEQYPVKFWLEALPTADEQDPD